MFILGLGATSLSSIHDLLGHLAGKRKAITVMMQRDSSSYIRSQSRPLDISHDISIGVDTMLKYYYDINARPSPS